MKKAPRRLNPNNRKKYRNYLKNVRWLSGKFQLSRYTCYRTTKTTKLEKENSDILSSRSSCTLWFLARYLRFMHNGKI